MNYLKDGPRRAMNPFPLIRDVAVFGFRQRFCLSPVLAALWLITCASAVAHGQDSTPSPPPAGAERAAPGANGHGRIKPSDAPPATSASPTPSLPDDSSGDVEKAIPEQEQPSSPVTADADALPEDSVAGSAPE